MSTKSLRQRCAMYILDNPGCAVLEIMVGIQAYDKGTKVMCKLLKVMTDAGELTREGALKSYTYTAGPNVMRAVEGVKEPAKKSSGRKGIKNIKHSNIMQIRQTWVKQGDYRVEPGDMMYRSLWDYANSFTKVTA